MPTNRMRRSDSQRANGTSINEICILCRPIECVVVTARGPMNFQNDDDEWKTMRLSDT
ncbi:hypothetical protein T11_13277 [Trichinella zimbabwensis]|uniref:Uncharacterized protein n=1 Tax=Trichinella zimbabwensis TaxID=268475 RepID=A0A0V1GHJ8_9BILA|nr:hypothetical protein T11_13277 [Trichinella zimbabwensis]